MPRRLQERVDPLRLADQSRWVDGAFPLKELPALEGLLYDAVGEARFSFQFSRDSERRACMRGTVEAHLQLECQRCLGKLEYPVRAEVAVVFVSGFEEAEALPDDLEPEFVDEGRISLKSLVEAELVLAIPHTPKHPAAECEANTGATVKSKDTVAEESAHPFAVLAELKSNKRDA